MRNKTIYVSGGMSAYSEEQIRERFGKAEEYLKGMGYRVKSPARWRWFLRFLSYRKALAFDILMMGFCDSVYMLDGWTDSEGATAEHAFACSTGMTILYER